MPYRTRVAARLVALLFPLLALPRASRAQLPDSVHLAVGSRVWVRMRDGTEGAWRFERASPDSLTLRRRVHGGDLIRSVSWSETERVDTVVVGPPSGRRMLVGGVKGGLLGVMVAGLGAVFSGPCHWDKGSCPGFGFVILAPEIIATGLFTGAAMGLHHRDWHWSTAWRAPTLPAAPER